MQTREFLDLNEALELMQARMTPITGLTDFIALDAASDRVVAEAIRAPMDVPPFTASAMDGYAVCSTDPIFAQSPPYRLPLQGTSRAGAPFNAELRPDHAVRILTGAVLPLRCDAVVIQESAHATPTDVALESKPAQGDHVRPAGHDVKAGATLLEAGARLGPFDLAWLTACGATTAPVRPLIRLAMFSTGDELRDAPTVLGPGQIYDANRRVLTELLKPLPISISDYGIVVDDPQQIEAMLADAAARHDVILTSGGVSVGDADHVRGAVEHLGQLEFWKIAIKPGKPVAFGQIADCWFFGLPGNPVSTIVTFLLLVKPMLTRLAGMPPVPPLRLPARLSAGIGHTPGRAEYQRGSYATHTDTATDAPVLIVAPTSDQSSNRLGSFHGANCLIEIPGDCAALAPGNAVSILPFKGLLD